MRFFQGLLPCHRILQYIKIQQKFYHLLFPFLNHPAIPASWSTDRTIYGMSGDLGKDDSSDFSGMQKMEEKACGSHKWTYVVG
jgi:hypothetical protein